MCMRPTARVPRRYSNVASGQTQAATSTTTAPSAPSGVTATASSSNPTSSIALAWTDTATNESGYVVERSSDGSTFSQRAQLGAGATSYLDSGLSSGTKYYYRVYAYNSAGSSTYSNVASALTQASSPATTTAPSAPTNPSPADGVTGINGSITLGWTATNA